MSRTRRLFAAVGFLAAVTTAGVIGYLMVEDVSLLDAVYMTFITISTVGFSEVFDLSTGGRILTILIIFLGVGAALYTAVAALELAVEQFLGGQWRQRRTMKEISRLHDHVIICGFGRVGSKVWQALETEGTRSVVVEAQRDRADRAADAGALVVYGDATRDDVLTEAGIDRARTLVASVQSDADNLVIVLSAKTRRPELAVIARATEEASEQKLRLAGADRTVAPQVVGAQRLAALASQPKLEEFVDLILHGKLVELRIEEINIEEGARVAGKILRHSEIRETTGALVLAVEDEHGHLVFNPDPDHRIEAGQTIIGMGNPNQLEDLRAMAMR